MFNKTMYELGSHRSVIRELFEFGKKRAAEVGADKVYDFSLGNPNVPAPDCVKEAAENCSLFPTIPSCTATLPPRVTRQYAKPSRTTSMRVSARACPPTRYI